MKYTKAFSVDNFKFWSHAIQVVDAFREANMLDDLQQIIEDVFADRTPTEVEINNFVGFDVPVEYMESLGIEI